MHAYGKGAAGFRGRSGAVRLVDQLRRAAEAERRLAAALRRRGERHREPAQFPLQSQSRRSALGRETGQEIVLARWLQEIRRLEAPQ